MFDNLSERLERSFKLLKGEGKITEINVAETLKDVRRALLDADVNYKVAKTFTDKVKEKALGQNVLTSVKPSQLMVKIVHDELAQLMGGTATELNLEGRPAVILMSGLQGSGKTTFTGKLANMLKTKKNKKRYWSRIQHYQEKQETVAGSLRRLSSGRYRTVAGIGRTNWCAGLSGRRK